MLSMPWVRGRGLLVRDEWESSFGSGGRERGLLTRVTDGGYWRGLWVGCRWWTMGRVRAKLVRMWSVCARGVDLGWYGDGLSWWILHGRDAQVYGVDYHDLSLRGL